MTYRLEGCTAYAAVRGAVGVDHGARRTGTRCVVKGCDAMEGRMVTKVGTSSVHGPAPPLLPAATSGSTHGKRPMCVATPSGTVAGSTMPVLSSDASTQPLAPPPPLPPVARTAKRWRRRGSATASSASTPLPSLLPGTAQARAHTSTWLAASTRLNTFMSCPSGVSPPAPATCTSCWRAAGVAAAAAAADMPAASNTGSASRRAGGGVTGDQMRMVPLAATSTRSSCASV